MGKTDENETGRPATPYLSGDQCCGQSRADGQGMRRGSSHFNTSGWAKVTFLRR